MIGMLLAGVVAIMGGMLWLRSLGEEREGGNVVEYGIVPAGEQKMVELPSCCVLYITTNLVAGENEFKDIYYSNVKMWINPSQNGKGTLTYASDWDKFMNIEQQGDTLHLSFRYSKKYLPEKYQSQLWLHIMNSGLDVGLPSTVQRIHVNNGMEVAIEALRTDSLSLSAIGSIDINDSHFRSLHADRGEVHFRSGSAKGLYYDVDNVLRWSVDAEHTDVDTEYLTGSGRYSNYLHPGECRRVVWLPKNKNAELVQTLREAAEIVVSE